MSTLSTESMIFMISRIVDLQRSNKYSSHQWLRLEEELEFHGCCSTASNPTTASAKMRQHLYRVQIESRKGEPHHHRYCAASSRFPGRHSLHYSGREDRSASYRIHA